MNSTVLRWVVPGVFLAIMFGGIGVSQAAGQWITNGRQQVKAGQQLTADDLRGWMTLQEAADGLRLPVADLIELVGAPDGVAISSSTAFKDLEGLVPGFELAAFRDALRARLAAAEPAAAPSRPVTAPTAPTQPANPAGPGPEASGTHAPVPNGGGASSGITGSMTLRQVAQANGLDPVTLVRQAGLPADVSLDAALRELRDVVPGFEIQAVRDAVAALK